MLTPVNVKRSALLSCGFSKVGKADGKLGWETGFDDASWTTFGESAGANGDIAGDNARTGLELFGGESAIGVSFEADGIVGLVDVGFDDEANVG